MDWSSRDARLSGGLSFGRPKYDLAMLLTECPISKKHVSQHQLRAMPSQSS